MKPIEFCYWLQRRFVLNNTFPDKNQWDDICENLNNVFKSSTIDYKEFDKKLFKDLNCVSKMELLDAHKITVI